MTVQNIDSRIKAFCDPQAPEVFHAVAHRHEIWKEDPFDVEEIHAEAREVFQRYLNRVSGDSQSDYGSIMLLLGEGGAGKTHLMRAFRNYTHGHNLGCFAYMQLGTNCNNYSRYILSKLIDSFNNTYFDSRISTNALMMLSNYLAESECLQQKTIRVDGESFSMTHALCELDLPSNQLNTLVQRMAETLINKVEFQKIDIDLLSAFLFLQVGKAALKNYTLKYLRGEDLSISQRNMLGGIVPKCQEHEAAILIEQIGHLIKSCRGMALVICLDQLEDIYNLENSQEMFQRAMTCIRGITDNVPSSLVVISCLEDYYTELKQYLTGPLIDRIENDPGPLRLESRRSLEEIKKLITYRLQYLYDSMEVDCSQSQDLYYPFQEEEIQTWENLRTRDVIDNCRGYRNRMMKGTDTVNPVDPNSLIVFEQSWNDFLANFSPTIPDDSESLTQILSQAIEQVSPELDEGIQLKTKMDLNLLDVDGYKVPLKVGLCNKKAQGGGLQREIEKFEQATEIRVMVIARTSEFPSSPSSKISKYIGTLLAKGARRVVIEDSDWRTFLAYHEFKNQRSDQVGFATWQQTERPLSRLQSIQRILDISNPIYTRRIQPESAPATQTSLLDDTSETQAHTEEKPTASSNTIYIGKSKGRFGGDITFNLDEFKRHAAFLGGSGSGKTTLALQIIEQMLVKKIPVILVDRKGDLASYANNIAWNEPLDKAATIEKRNVLKDSINIQLYTPGDPRGYTLSFSLLPKDCHQLPSIEREQLAKYASSSLAGMMDYSERNRNHKQQITILQIAIGLLSELITNREVTIQDVIGFIDEQDPVLVNRTERLDNKLFKKLVEDLSTLHLNKSRLFRHDGTHLDISALFGNGEQAKAGKTNLSIISTKFLGDNQDIDFWVARFLVELERWISRNPSDQLQGVILFDEADIYLPANRKPSTKEPIESLLKRARSAGVGIFLSTQSPGDFDYRCRDNIRTWFLGRIKEDTALKKLKPMLSEQQADIEHKLAGQSTGEFYVIRDGKVDSLIAEKSIIKANQLPEDKILQLAGDV